MKILGRNMPGKNNSKPKVLFLNHWGKEPGGAEYSLIDILKKCSSHFNCHLLTTEEGHLTQKVKDIGVTVHIIKANPKLALIKRDKFISINIFYLFFFISFLFNSKKKISTISPDLIYANVPKSHMLLLLTQFLGIKTPGIIHMREIFKSPIIKFLYSLFYPKKTTTTICISNAVQKSLPKKLYNTSTVIYNGVNIPDTARKENTSDTIRLLFLGRIVPWKGCEKLIEILKELNNSSSDINFTLTLCGDTSYWKNTYRDDLLEMIKNFGMEQSCTLLPRTEDISKIFLNHDIFVNASSEEPFGRVIAEAQAYGLPVVSYSGGAVSEIITNETGYVVKMDEISNFCDKLLLLGKNPKLRVNMGYAGKLRVEENFNSNTQTDLICSYILNKITM